MSVVLSSAEAEYWRTARDFCNKQVMRHDGKTASPIFTSRLDEMPTGEATHPDMVAHGWYDWPTLTDVYGITIHHTMSHSPIATAEYCVKTKGHASIQYHFWCSQNDTCDVWQVADLSKAIWHDHTGSHADGRGTISVGLAGRLHESKPPEGQLMKAAALVAWLMGEYEVGRVEVQGHNGRFGGTVCPGWDEIHWRWDWNQALDAALLAAGVEQ